jgi:hypothetical protein
MNQTTNRSTINQVRAIQIHSIAQLRQGVHQGNLKLSLNFNFTSTPQQLNETCVVSHTAQCTPRKPDRNCKP